MSTNDNKNAEVQKVTKPSKIKTWWSNNWGKVLTGAAAIAGAAGLVYLGKEGKEILEDGQLQKYEYFSGLRLRGEPGTYLEKVNIAVKKIREEKELDNLNEVIREKVGELSDLCKEKGVNVMLGTELGTDDNVCDIMTYIDGTSVNID